ncbi:cobalt-zinc-cadmium efflux system protein [Salinimicrobium catena]|uniref:Cobalt-zinc-cadmium efflux system protein n=1 Tax=Salinimicrobium catena TaxID=390640 RepID=A0A1H5JSH5_9FLAO|nr:cation diffusion facilitator family transporter [Salinimicrobium catena]SDK89987.1 cobalt-zinc-cadmium efflux system protein [Salinimicrobium catena]SEE55499.1 cobalt-zinc-cadmium efflux system protein [Salinimicrobium catena]
MGHDHSHESSGKNLKLAFFINVGFTIIEIIGGFLTNSVAIISDALHDLGDSLSLGLAWYIEGKANKKGATDEFSFGYARFRLLGALINSVVLVAGSIYIIYEAISRFQDPEAVDSKYMIGFAILGVLANGYAAWRVSGGKSLNDKVVSWHLLEDVLGWVAVLIVAIILQFKDWYILDPILSLGITLYILWGVGGRLKDTLHLLLQGVPAGLDMQEVKRQLQQVNHVSSIHHMHVWSLDGEHHVLTAHLVLEKISHFDQIDDVRQRAIESVEEWDFSHHTFQLELDKEKCPMLKSH